MNQDSKSQLESELKAQIEDLGSDVVYSESAVVVRNNASLVDGQDLTIDGSSVPVGPRAEVMVSDEKDTNGVKKKPTGYFSYRCSTASLSKGSLFDGMKYAVYADKYPKVSYTKPNGSTVDAYQVPWKDLKKRCECILPYTTTLSVEVGGRKTALPVFEQRIPLKAKRIDALVPIYGAVEKGSPFALCELNTSYCIIVDATKKQ